MRPPKQNFLLRIAPRLLVTRAHNCPGDPSGSDRCVRYVRAEPMGHSKMAAFPPLADFSFDRYLLFVPVSAH